MLNIIKELKELDIEINLKYRNSKFPKFIKKRIAASRRKQLYKIIDNLDEWMNSEIPMEILCEYFRVIYDTYPPYGRYRNCSKIVMNGNSGNTITFIKKIDEENLATMIVGINTEEYHAIINYIYMKSGKTAASYIENIDCDDLLVRNNKIEMNDITKANINDKKQIIRNVCIDSLHEDIIYFMRDLIERSERVYKL